MSEHTASPQRRIGLLIWLIFSHLLAMGSLLFWSDFAAYTRNAFDYSMGWLDWAYVIAIWSYPLILLLLVAGAWIAFALRKNRLADALSKWTFAPMIVLMWNLFYYWIIL